MLTLTARDNWLWNRTIELQMQVYSIWHNVLGILGPQCSSTVYLFGFITILIWASLMKLM